ncbi:pimeloyl-ACP methyl ester carboxylesterase [Mycetocola sp. BIGb0189]|uniref:alpha/beta hydrolase n=1 Tax=Mycetocola sp. BIGb0189 TaxID=2940604 RepID=UPI002166D622|nr:alpha/beta hydrolase [Mycetocola sp. BIGb0189]MCS4276261.1 pimeloyl-ACP methyl ester carboxylesterase [Mycetocola sp. BIGb0189]
MPQPNQTRRRVLGALALVVAAGLTLTGCVTAFLPSPAGQSAPSPLPATEVAENLRPFYGQEVSWRACGSKLTCADIKTPMNWEDPGAGDLTLSLVRAAASGSDRIGSLLVNPGGPGGSGVELVKDSLDFAVDKTLQSRFDVIGFDPRGVGKSSPVKCLSDKDTDKFLFDTTQPRPGQDGWLEAARTQARDYGEACKKNTGAELEFITTVNSARDMDLIRSLVGDPKLNYLGYSYGTFLGATYAQLYPKNTGRLVLDGAIDPAVSSTEVSATQAAGFESALRAYLADCLTGSKCPFRGDVESAMTTISNLLESVDASPLTGKDGRKVGSSTLMTAIIFPLYSPNNWSALSDLFTSVMAGDADYALYLADMYFDRDDSGKYTSNSNDAFNAYNCRDYPSNDDPAVMEQEAAKIEARAPIFGKYMSYGDVLCANWPYPDGAERGPIHAPGSPDILVIGTTNDPATPYAWAQSLAKQLDKGHLVTYKGEGHTAYNKGSQCINTTVDDFFITGKVPSSDPQCS